MGDPRTGAPVTAEGRNMMISGMMST
jgi:hypothetical protein